MKTFISLLCFSALFGCRPDITKAINEHRKVAHLVELGDSKSKVLGILIPTQASLASDVIKPPEKFMQGNNRIEIHYMRSQIQPDGLMTDDEYTPYYFKNDILTGIGWQHLGGAKSHGQVVPTTTVNTSTTIIDY